MADHVLLSKRQHGHGAHADATPTGFWKPGRPAPYGNLDIPLCEGEENCDYWDKYYTQHNRHILGMFITWGIIALILLGVSTVNAYRRSMRKIPTATTPPAGTKGEETTSTTPPRGLRAFTSTLRHYLIPQSLFGLLPSVTRLQALIFLLLALYCILFSVIGIAYETWKNPTKPPGKRVGVLEFMGDRTGCLAFAFIPLVFLLSSRDNIFSLITGISYQHFNPLHRWVGRWIFILTWIHTVFWSIELGVMYQPQPDRYKLTWKKRYWKYGVGATALLTYLFVHSLRTVRERTGYEFFRKTHEVIAVLFLGACWGHWPEMREWMIAGIAIVFFDRFVRYFRMFLIHMNWTTSERGTFGLRPYEATITRYHDTQDNISVLVLRIPKCTTTYRAGHHFFLTFPTISLFQSHPFTPTTRCNPIAPGQKTHEQTYIIRAFNGQTSSLARLCVEPNVAYPLPTIICGPYGNSVLDSAAENIQLIAGGTGVSFTLPLAQEIVSTADKGVLTKKMDFVWIVRRDENRAWIERELEELREQARRKKEECGLDVFIRIFVTRDNESAFSSSTTTPSNSSTTTTTPTDPEKITSLATSTASPITNAPPSESVTSTPPSATHLHNAHPPASTLITEFISSHCVQGRVQVLASGPEGLGRDIRMGVAGVNGKNGGWDVGCYWDCREY